MAQRRWRIKIITRWAVIRMAILLVALAALTLAWGGIMMKMPGKSWRGALPPLTAEQAALGEELRRDVEELAGRIGERNVIHYDELARAADFIEDALTSAGCAVQRQEYMIERRPYHNLEVEIKGPSRPEEIVIVGAHYDSAIGAPGANDNASGVAAMLALARRLAPARFARTLRFVAFTNEESFFQSEGMGSLVYARRCRERGEQISAMICLETMGYFSDKPNTQQYPFPLSLVYPSTGNFIGFIGDTGSVGLVRRTTDLFRRHAQFPSEGAALPDLLPGVGWSDHWAFWQFGYRALMVTDTAPYRYPFYHTTRDTPDKIDYDRLARVTEGLEKVTRALADE